MQAIILAAGKGARLLPITLTLPKPLIQVAQKSLLEHTLDSLPENIDEIFIIVNHLKDQIINAIGSHYKTIPIQYITQEPLNGTAGALTLIKDRLHDNFLVMNADNLYLKKDIERLVAHDWAILVYKTDHQLKAGAQIHEALFRDLGPGNNAVCGAYVLREEFFDASFVEIKVSKFQEFGLPQTLATIADIHPIHTIETTQWHQVGTPEQLERAQKLI